MVAARFAGVADFGWCGRLVGVSVAHQVTAVVLLAVVGRFVRGFLVLGLVVVAEDVLEGRAPVEWGEL